MPPLPVFRTEAAPAGMWRSAVRNRHISVPLAAPPVLLVAGMVLHAARPGWQAVAGAVVVTAAVWVWAPRKWDRRAEVAYARYSTAAAAGWLAAASYADVPVVMRIVLLAGCGVWGFLWWRHKRPRRDRRHERLVAIWDRWWQVHAAAWGLPGSAVVDVEERGALESLLVQLRGGRQSAGDLRTVTPRLESALGGYVHHGMTRTEVNKANPSQVWVHLKREDPLREEIGWDDDAAPSDIALPAPLGVRESGVWLDAVLRASFFILGRSRRGKSNELSVMLASATRCRNARVLLIDMKGGRAARPWLPAVDWLATTTVEARLVLGMAVAEIKARGAYAYTGEEQLHPTDEVPTLFVVIDETYEVTSYTSRGDSVCADLLAVIASQGQGLEVYAWVTSQHGSLENTVRTEQTRSNLNRRMCFQTETRAHGTFALGDDAHTKVDTTSLAEKGQFYWRADSETSPEQIRGPHLPHDLARRIATANAARTAVHDRRLLLYAGNVPCEYSPGLSWQEVYDGRWGRLPEAFHRDAPQAAVSVPVSASVPAGTRAVPAEVESQVRAINDEVDGMPDMTEADLARARELRAARGAGPVDLRKDFDHRRRQFAVLFESAGPDGITQAQLVQGTGFSREWVRRLIKSLDEINAIAKIGKGYRPLADVWEALETIRVTGERLGAEARRMTGV